MITTTSEKEAGHNKDEAPGPICSSIILGEKNKQKPSDIIHSKLIFIPVRTH